MAKWSELKEQGIHRCCVTYSSGKQCRRRASPDFGNSWCSKHGPEMKAHTEWHMKVVAEQKESEK